MSFSAQYLWQGLVIAAAGGVQPAALARANWSAVPSTLPVLALAFVYQNVVPVIASSLEVRVWDLDQSHWAQMVSVVCCTCCCLGWAYKDLLCSPFDTFSIISGKSRLSSQDAGVCCNPFCRAEAIALKSVPFVISEGSAHLLLVYL